MKFLHLNKKASLFIKKLAFLMHVNKLLAAMESVQLLIFYTDEYTDKMSVLRYQVCTDEYNQDFLC